MKIMGIGRREVQDEGGRFIKEQVNNHHGKINCYIKISIKYLSFKEDIPCSVEFHGHK